MNMVKLNSNPGLMISLYVEGNKGTLIEWLIQKIGDFKPDNFLTVVSPCGLRYCFYTYDSLPGKDMPCECGHPNHWIIKYGELKDRS